MKDMETKNRYVQLRAEGKSYATICEVLHISKATCTRWAADLEAEISDAQKQAREDLIYQYALARNARIARLGKTLNKLDAAVEQADFSAVEPRTLLDYQLKYTDALKDETAGADGSGTMLPPSMEPTPQYIQKAMGDLLSRVQRGDVSQDQAQRESVVLANLLKTHDSIEIDDKLSALEDLVQKISANKTETNTGDVVND